jgi:hypothetical protein
LGIILSVIVVSASWKHEPPRILNLPLCYSVISVNRLPHSIISARDSNSRSAYATVNLPGTTALVDFITNKFELALPRSKGILGGLDFRFITLLLPP